MSNGAEILSALFPRAWRNLDNQLDLTWRASPL